MGAAYSVPARTAALQCSPRRRLRHSLANGPSSAKMVWRGATGAARESRAAWLGGPVGIGRRGRTAATFRGLAPRPHQLGDPRPHRVRVRNPWASWLISQRHKSIYSICNLLLLYCTSKCHARTHTLRCLELRMIAVAMKMRVGVDRVSFT